MAISLSCPQTALLMLYPHREVYSIDILNNISNQDIPLLSLKSHTYIPASCHWYRVLDNKNLKLIKIIFLFYLQLIKVISLVSVFSWNNVVQESDSSGGNHT